MNRDSMSTSYQSAANAEEPKGHWSAVNEEKTSFDFRVSFIDVGKGDCILIQVGDSAALIDTGYANTSHETIAYLRKQGVKSLDFVIITHYDRDHIGGIHEIGKAFRIGTVFLPGYTGADKNYRSLMTTIRDLGLSAQSITERMFLSIGDAQLSVVPSDVEYSIDAKHDEGNDNDLSLVAMLSHGNDTYLFAGDLEEEGIASFLAGSYGNFDIVKMPEHGQKSSNTDEFLAAVQPKVAIITDSHDDPANKKVLKLLQASCSHFYRTSIDGTIVVQSSGIGKYSVSCN